MLWGHKLEAQRGVGAKVLVSRGHGALIAFWLLGWERQVPAEPFGMMPVDIGSLPTPTERRARN